MIINYKIYHQKHEKLGSAYDQAYDIKKHLHGSKFKSSKTELSV